MHPLLYELNTRCWLREISGRIGRRITLADVPDSEFQHWRDLGFTHIWLMGVWTTGPRSRAVALAVSDVWRGTGDSPLKFGESDIAGSPYAIAEYQVPVALGGDTGLKQFRQKLHAHGLKLVLDFVPNHVGLDHRWTHERSELFVQSPVEVPGMFTQETNAGRRWLAHGRDPNFAPWIDTVQLDYRQPATRAAMQSELMRIAERCDGVRCDMAMLILNDVFANTWKGFPPVGAPTEGGTVRNDLPEFWLDAIRAVKQAHPEFLFLAEVYWGMEQRLQSHGFDYTYDKVLYDELIHRNPVAVQRHLLDSSPVYVAAGAHFLENHDEARIASILSLPEHRAAAALILTLPGMRLLHEGQLQGAQVRLPVQLTCRPAEPAQREVAGMYEQLLQAVKRAGVGQGSWCLLKPRAAWPDNPTAQDFVLVQWQSAPDDFVLAVINLAPHPSQCYAPLEVVGLETTEWQIADLIGTEKHRRLGNELVEKGLFLDLPAHGAQLLQFSPARA